MFSVPNSAEREGLELIKLAVPVKPEIYAMFSCYRDAKICIFEVYCHHPIVCLDH